MTEEASVVSADSAREIHGLIDDVIQIDEDEGRNNAVYVLECAQYIKDDDAMREYLKRRHTPDRDGGPSTWRYPSKFDTAIAADIVYYVGESGNLSQRIKDHMSMQGSTLTKEFPPYSIECIEWVESREAALERESELVDELGNIDEMPSHMFVNSHDVPDHFDRHYQTVEEIFPSKIESLSDRGVYRFSHAITYAREQDGVLASDTEKIHQIALERAKELEKKEPEALIFAQGG